MTRQIWAIMLLLAYSSLLTGFIGGSAYRGAGWIYDPLIMNQAAAEMQRAKTGN